MVSKWCVLASVLFLTSPTIVQAADVDPSRSGTNFSTLQKLYPARALAAHEQGSVGFAAKLDKDGRPLDCSVTKSSGYPLLDQETCELITLHAVFDRPASAGSTFAGVVEWKLPTSGATPAAAPASIQTTLADPQEKVICRRVAATGSNVATERVCATRRAWDNARAEARDQWDVLQGRKGSTSGR